MISKKNKQKFSRISANFYFNPFETKQQLLIEKKIICGNFYFEI